MKKRWVGIMTALAGVLLAGTAQAIVIETNLVIAAGTYTGANEITTTLSYNGAFFDIVYTLDSVANGSNSFITAGASSAGVASDTDITQHYGTLEGNDGEGMSFTGLTLTNFRPYASGLEREDISDVRFVSFAVGAANNNQDGVDISFIGHGLTNANKAISSGGASQTVDLTVLANYPVTPTLATDLYIKCDNTASANRWNFGGVGVSYKVDTGNEVPVADPQNSQILPDNTLDIELSGSDFEGSNLTYSVDDTGLLGTIIAASNLWYVYTPPTGYEGVDSFTFTVNDGTDDSDPATVSITVTNELPVATAQSLEAYRNSSLDITLAGTNSDGPSNLTYSVISGPTDGTLNTNAGRNVTYTPDIDFAGEDSFTFTTYDGLASSTGGIVSITVVNNPPVADPQIVLTQPDTAVAITLTGSDPDESGVVTFAVDTLPANGTLTGTEPNMTYTPTNGFTGVDSFTYTASDGETISAAATVSISVSAGGFNLNFIDFNPALSDNTLNVGGVVADLTGVSTNLDFVYSFSFSGADIDGDATNDDVTFDVRVKAWTNGVTDLGFDSVQGSSNISSVAIGTSNIVPKISNLNSFTTAGNSMFDGSTLGFIIENVGVSLSDGNQDGTATSTGFSEAHLEEINNGHSHQVIFGEGSELLGYFWSTPDNLYVSELDQGPDTLYISSSLTTNAVVTRPLNWGVKNLDFGITVALTSADIPPVSVDVSGSDLVFSWEGGGTYNVLTNLNLAVPTWGVAVPNTTSPATIAVGSEDVLFYKLSE